MHKMHLWALVTGVSALRWLGICDIALAKRHVENTNSSLKKSGEFINILAVAGLSCENLVVYEFSMYLCEASVLDFIEFHSLLRSWIPRQTACLSGDAPQANPGAARS